MLADDLLPGELIALQAALNQRLDRVSWDPATCGVE